MSLISKQIDELRLYAKDRKGELAKLINDAADTIELLSAKLYASQMERSNQYYHGGWIPCSERLPEETGKYLVTQKEDGDVGFEVHETMLRIMRYDNVNGWCIPRHIPEWINEKLTDVVTAWRPLPEPYKGEQDG